MTGKQIRSWSLIGMIIADVGMLAFWWLGGHYTFFWVFVGISLCVVVGEIVNTLWVYGKTLSTQTKHAINEGGSKRLYTYLAIAFLGVAIASLIIHLGVAWN